MTKLSAAATRRLIELRHQGTRWTTCAEELGVPASDLRRLSVKLRDAGKWCLPSQQPARGASIVGLSERGPGRPRTAHTTRAVNLRLPIDVARALREVAVVNGLRMGVVLSEAMEPARELTFTPRAVSLGFPKINVNVRVDAAVHERFTAEHPKNAKRIVDACVELLRRLGCEVVAERKKAGQA